MSLLGLKARVGSALFAFQGECNVHSLRSTSGATHCQPLDNLSTVSIVDGNLRWQPNIATYWCTLKALAWSQTSAMCATAVCPTTVLYRLALGFNLPLTMLNK